MFRLFDTQHGGSSVTQRMLSSSEFLKTKSTQSKIIILKNTKHQDRISRHHGDLALRTTEPSNTH